jgi:hypothetical protein
VFEEGVSMPRRMGLMRHLSGVAPRGSSKRAAEHFIIRTRDLAPPA